MRTLRLGIAGLTLAVAIAAPAQADAGKQAFGKVTFEDGTTMDVLMRYDRELSKGELWKFNFNIVGMTECQGIGTIGSGFVSAKCPTAFKLGGTNDTREAPDLRFETYKVPIEFGGKNGTFTETILPDPGL